jgi:peptidoglycan/xylan/chitin deacetylase (PgdA/CDA1 family)
MISLNKLVKSSLRGLVETMGVLINPILLKINGENNQLLIFYFHGLYESELGKNLNHIDPQNNMTIKQFDDFIDYFLSRNYNFIKPEDILEGLKPGKRYAMITFDDGYFNNSLAVGILEKYKVPAVFFIACNNILENRSFWWDVIFKNRFKQGISRKRIHEEQNHLKNFKYKYIDEYVKHTFGISSCIPWSDVDRPLTEQELKTLSQCPYVTIGNHTWNHAILPNYDRKEITQEFIDSNKYLHEITGITPDTDAFPNGYYNDLILKVAEEVGFRIAFNVLAQKNRLPVKSSNLICLGRFMTNPRNINIYGSFYRVGYTPGSLFSVIKESINPFGK